MLIEQIGLHRIFLYPVTDAHADEPYRLAGHVAVQKEPRGFSQHYPLVMGWNAELVPTGWVSKPTKRTFSVTTEPDRFSLRVGARQGSCRLNHALAVCLS